jgi:hypothetical protein
MSLLSVIILGEGIIVTDKAISKIVKNNYGFDTAIVIQVVVAVLMICKCRVVLQRNKELSFRLPAGSSLKA